MLASLLRLKSKASRTRTLAQDDTVPERVSLSEMNNLLQILAEVFPEHEVSLLRELLLNASPESRLHIAANILIQHPERYAERSARSTSGQLAEWEKFRSTKYRATVERLLVSEFTRLAKSTIRNVVSDNNGDYGRSRDVLLGIASKSWRHNITAWIFRRSPLPALPPIDVTRQSTGHVRLDEEIYALKKPERDAQSSKDSQLAQTINREEHARALALIECECCFNDVTWEEVTVCTSGHFFCHKCVNRSVNEALYGQGGCLLLEKGTVRCISSVAVPACEGFVQFSLLSQALPMETLDKLEQRFVHDQLSNSGLQFVHCPACMYAVVDIPTTARPRLRAAVPLVLLAVVIIQLSFRFPIVSLALHVSFSLLLYLIQTPGTPPGLAAIRVWMIDAMTRVRRRHLGVRKVFTCENLQCRMSSCIDCGKQWTPFHNCYQDALDSQRLYVERAMSEAVKRTCPQCRVSFVKSGGCNLLTCLCGYQMCYVCRADVRRTRYKHFCQHFRPEAHQSCTQCDNCNLYETEDEHAVANEAAQRATEEWLAQGSAPEKGHLNPMPQTFGSGYPVQHWVKHRAEDLIEFVFEW